MLHSTISKTFFVIVIIISCSLCAQTVIGSFRVVSVASHEVARAVDKSKWVTSNSRDTLQELERLNQDLDWVKDRIKK